MKTLLLIFVLSYHISYGQNWIDTAFHISTEMEVTYGIATSFEGKQDTLKLDISYPENDTPPQCGRPLMVIVHGGAWIGGDKNQGYPTNFREDFAKRGYVTASINYRLGVINTNLEVNCNVSSLFDVPWNCLNTTDSSEWYRANYRGIQDVHGAIRFLSNQKSTYQIDPNNVFVVGESAGGFIAMGVGFIDDTSEVINSLVGSYVDAPTPNMLYENCVPGNSSNRDLSRPPLGNYEGTLNFPLLHEYKIQAVGNFYGGAFNNIFSSFDTSAPGLYLYHQTCDLIVPYEYNRLLNGYTYCLSQFPTFCGNIINRAHVYGSKGIKNLIDTMTLNSIPTSPYFFDNYSVNYDCFQQTNPALACHAIDNYWKRTTNMATYFASQIDACFTVNLSEKELEESIVKRIYPNPADEFLNIELNSIFNVINIEIVNTLGESMGNFQFTNVAREKINLHNLTNGVYYAVFSNSDSREIVSFVKI